MYYVHSEIAHPRFEVGHSLMEDLSCGFVEHIFGMVILSPEILCLSETEKTYNMCVCVSRKEL